MLGFTRTAQADAALLSLQVGPAAHQTGGHMPQLRQLHLELAFEAACSLRENIENHAGTVNDPAVETFLEIALLTGTQRCTGHDQLSVVAGNDVLQLLEFSLADEVARIRTAARTDHFANDDGPCRDRKLKKFCAFIGVRRSAGGCMNQNGAIAATRSLKQSRPPGTIYASSDSPVSPSGNGSRTLRAGTMVEIACL